ncbi:hypothetical protein [Methylocella sp.]
MRNLAFLLAALVGVKLVSNLIYNHRFMAQPESVRKLTRRYL